MENNSIQMAASPSYRSNYRLCAAVFHQWLHENCLLKRLLSLARQRSSKTGRKTSSVASAVWHVTPSCWNQMLPISSSSISNQFVQHGPITITIDCNALSLLIFKEKWPNYASEPKSAPNSDSFCGRRLFSVCMRVFCAPNATICLFTCPPRSKWASSENMIFCQNRCLL